MDNEPVETPDRLLAALRQFEAHLLAAFKCYPRGAYDPEAGQHELRLRLADLEARVLALEMRAR